MRTVDKYSDQNDEFIHPLWLGILLLFSVIVIIGFLCCIRIKCNAQLRILCNRLFHKKPSKKENGIHEEKQSTVSYSHNWPSIYTSSKNQSPKLYTLIKNMRTANHEKQPSLKRQSSTEVEIEREINVTAEINQPHTSLPFDDNHAAEIARKFYAGMRQSIEYDASPPLDIHNNNSSPKSDNYNPMMINSSIHSKQEEHIGLFSPHNFPN